MQKSSIPQLPELPAKRIDTIILNMQVEKSIKRVRLDNVYYMPDVRKTLMSVAHIEKKGHELIIKDGTIKIRNISTKGVLCIVLRSNDLYIVKLLT